MRLVLVTSVYLPMRSSGAIQLADLVEELVEQGHFITVMTPSETRILGADREVISMNYNILRLGAMNAYNVSRLRRLLAEVTSPYFLAFNYFRLKFEVIKYDGIIWYSPSIFLGPFISLLKRKYECKAYLILRDIFPNWAYNVAIIKSKLVYFFLKRVEINQYKIADTIGVQSNNDIFYLNNLFKRSSKDVHKLNNWLTPRVNASCSIDLNSTPLRGRKIIVYAGNMGPAQGMEYLFQLLKQMKKSQEIGFLFIGRGDCTAKLDTFIKENQIKNVLRFDEISPNELSGLYDQCHCGLISLDQRHVHNNIPGKFLSYIGSGLPVFAILNEGNELIDLIKNYRVGDGYEGSDLIELERRLVNFLYNFQKTVEFKKRCSDLHANLFSTNHVAKVIVSYLDKK